MHAIFNINYFTHSENTIPLHYSFISINISTQFLPKQEDMATRVFTGVIFVLSFVIMMMINNSHGSLSNHYDANQCNGTIKECHSLVEESEEVVLMDTEEHRRLLDEKNVISLGALKAGSSPACSGNNNCAGLYNVKHRQCLTTYKCPH
ncbi:hypothetical protein Hanom_Chr17g01550511 [Helianthus anomalus]